MSVPVAPPPVPVDQATVTAGQSHRDEGADHRALAYIAGLLSAAERKNGW